jgi:putative chitinase
MSLKSLQAKIGATPDGIWGPNVFKVAMAYYKFTPARASHFFAQTAHETGGFNAFTENLNYSADGLTKIFKKYFPTLASAQSYARNPEKIANRVYASRMGNGPERSGDGWRYRGRGALQLTGKDNYAMFAKFIGRPDVMSNPDLVASELAFESALFFFERNKLWAICDQGITDSAILALTKKVNGGTHGLADRSEKTKKYFSWTVDAAPVISTPIDVSVKQEPISLDMRLSPHFKLLEFIKSEIATRKRIDNTPSTVHLINLKKVCEKILEPVRTHFSNPVRITSGYRSPALNAAVGGSAKSQHCNGEAVDFEIDGLPNPNLAKWVSENCEYDQIILEFYDSKEGPNSGWVHASYSEGNNRKQILTAVTVNGKTLYKPGLVL